MLVKVFLTSQGDLLHNLSSQRRERLPLHMAALLYHILILFSLLVFTVDTRYALPWYHTFASPCSKADTNLGASGRTLKKME